MFNLITLLKKTIAEITSLTLLLELLQKPHWCYESIHFIFGLPGCYGVDGVSVDINK